MLCEGLTLQPSPLIKIKSQQARFYFKMVIHRGIWSFRTHFEMFHRPLKCNAITLSVTWISQETFRIYWKSGFFTNILQLTFFYWSKVEKIATEAVREDLNFLVPSFFVLFWIVYGKNQSNLVVDIILLILYRCFYLISRDLEGNQIDYIHPGAFHPVQHLQDL